MTESEKLQAADRDVPFITAVRNAVSNENGGIDCEIQFQGAMEADGVTPLFLPYTSTPSDNAEYGPQLYAALVAGEYGDIPPFMATPEIIRAAKDRKRGEINAWRDVQESREYLFTYDGRRWDYGKATKARMSISLALAKRHALPEGFAWTDGDNNIVPVTNESLTALAAATEQVMFEKGMEINQRQLQMKAEVEALNDLRAIRHYVVGWSAVP